MFDDPLTPEQQAAMDRLSDGERVAMERMVEVMAGLGATIGEGAMTYVSLDPQGRALEGDARLEAQELIERIAEQWRQAELSGATDVRTIRELRSEPALSLLGAIEDSLILALTGDPRYRQLMLSLDDANERTGALAGFSELVEGSAQPPPSTGETWEELTPRFRELDRHLRHALDGATEVFVALGQRGELDEDAARERLEELAVCLRACDVERRMIVAFAERDDLRPLVAVLRTVLHGLVLLLAEDPARRAQAIALSELATRIVPKV